MQQNGDTIAGRKVELIVKDDTGLAPETTKRIAQELVVQDKVTVLAGFGLTPLALAAAPVATEAKVPMIVMAAATQIIPTRSPFIVRTGFTLPQVTAPIAGWAAKNKIKRVFTMVTDYAPVSTPRRRSMPGSRRPVARSSSRCARRCAIRLRAVPAACEGRQARRAVRVRALGEGLAVMKQFDERGLRARGIRMIGPGDVVDDDLLETMGRARVGVITSFHYSAAHESRRTAGTSTR